MIARRLPSYSLIPHAVPAGQSPIGGCRTSSPASRQERKDGSQELRGSLPDATRTALTHKNGLKEQRLGLLRADFKNTKRPAELRLDMLAVSAVRDRLSTENLRELHGRLGGDRLHRLQIVTQTAYSVFRQERHRKAEEDVSVQRKPRFECSVNLPCFCFEHLDQV